MNDYIFPKSADEMKQYVKECMKYWRSIIDEANSLCETYLENNKLNESNSREFKGVIDKHNKIQKIIKLYNDEFNEATE